MKTIFHQTKKVLLWVFAILFTGLSTSSIVVFAADNESGFTVSPMTQNLILNPGESYTASFNISNPGSNANDIKYELSVEPFYVNDSYETIFENINNSGQLAEWITINSPKTGTLVPNEHTEVTFTVDVPSNAPGGGQYASVVVTSKPVSESTANGDTSATINESFRIGHLVFAEITGNTVRQGEVVSANVPSFLLSGNIAGSSIIKNTGNIHGVAKYTLQIFPLFSNEEVYTNEEEPDKTTILPDRTLYYETAWDKTPEIGIFNVKYTVEFDGVTTEVSKMVIKCPIWLLFIIFFIIAAIIIWIVMRVKHHSAAKRKTTETTKE